ncbi:MAG: hypothetical protein PWQ67_2349 [Clostridia bacterium]|jgi:hypothetical protein|nr:hypothetical protein [Clostridia bacterium]MDN5323895.1 hypothetical protein [Clostridia bacterium]
MNKVRKGLVLEINKNKAIVLTPDGQFLERSFTGKTPEIGSEINIYSKTVNWKIWSMMGIAALLALIIIPFVSMQVLFSPQLAVAYVTIDINPSIELGLDEEDKVISMQALNEEGDLLLDKVRIKDLPIDQALEVITEAAIKEKYIKPEKENAVIISYTREKSVTENHSPKDQVQKKEKLVQKVLEEKVKQVIERNQQEAVVEIVQVTPKIRNEANELGLSSGKYTLMLQAWDEGLEISPEIVKEKSIVKAIKEVGGNPKQIIDHVHQIERNAEVYEELTVKFQERLAQMKMKNPKSKDQKRLTDNINKSIDDEDVEVNHGKKVEVGIDKEEKQKDLKDDEKLIDKNDAALDEKEDKDNKEEQEEKATKDDEEKQDQKNVDLGEMDEKKDLGNEKYKDKIKDEENENEKDITEREDEKHGNNYDRYLEEREKDDDKNDDKKDRVKQKIDKKKADNDVKTHIESIINK